MHKSKLLFLKLFNLSLMLLLVNGISTLAMEAPDASRTNEQIKWPVLNSFNRMHRAI